MSDLGLVELQSLLDETDAEAIALTLNLTGILVLVAAKDGNVDEMLKSVFIAGIHWARYRAERERSEGVEKMLKGVKGL